MDQNTRHRCPLWSQSSLSWTLSFLSDVTPLDGWTKCSVFASGHFLSRDTLTNRLPAAKLCSASEIWVYIWDIWGYPRSVRSNHRTQLPQNHPFILFRTLCFEKPTVGLALTAKHACPSWCKIAAAQPDCAGGACGCCTVRPPYKRCSIYFGSLIVSPWRTVEALAPSWSASACLSCESTVQKASSRGFPCRAACDAWDIVGPSSSSSSSSLSSRSHGRFCADAACSDGGGEFGQWVSDSMH